MNRELQHFFEDILEMWNVKYLKYSKNNFEKLYSSWIKVLLLHLFNDLPQVSQVLVF